MRNVSAAWLLLSWFGLFALIASAPAEARALPDFTKLVEQNSAAVVNISTSQKTRSSRALPPGLQLPEIPDGTPWGDLLRRFFENEEPIEEFDAQSLGSGCIIDPDGYVLTNYHVVKDAAEVVVRLQDRRELTAEIVGTDERSDLALLKIEANDLPAITIGASSKLKVGEWVMAIGSPFGFEHSVSVGVVSAKGRSLPSETYVPFIQTDVAINPGNSGGPLINLDGEVVGINSQIFSRTGGFMGLSFAIPIDVAMDVVTQLKERGYVSRGWLGVLIQDVNRELAESFGMERPMGAVVLRVLPDSPAAKAGMRVGDVVVRFDGTPIEHSSDLPVVVGRAQVGGKATVQVIREGKRVRLSVPIEELPEEVVLERREPQPSEVPANRLGVMVQDLGPEQRQRYNLEKGGGAQVQEVESGPALEAGIRRGDVILMLNNQEVKGAAHLRSLIDALPAGKSVPVLVQRLSGPVFLAIKVPGEEG